VLADRPLPRDPAIAGPAGLPAPASAKALALLRFPDRRTTWAVVVAASLAAPVDRIEHRLTALHRSVPMTGARLHGEVWHPGSPPAPMIVDGEPLSASALVGRFDLADQPPLRVVVGAEGRRLAVACHHAAFDGLGLLALLTALVGGPDHEGAEPGAAGLEGAQAGGGWGGRPRPELRGLAGRLVGPADRVAPSLSRPGREALVVREVRLAGPGVTARIVDAAVAAAGARNQRLGRPWRRIGVNVGLAGPEGGSGAFRGEPGGFRGGAGGLPGNSSRYRRVDLVPGEPAGPVLAAALASPREPLDQVWSPRFGWLLGPVAGRFSDSLLVSNLGRREVPGVARLDFFPVARGRSAVAVGAVGLAGGPATVSVRARDLSSEDAEALLADLAARLPAGP
jgi:hypothetical protein